MKARHLALMLALAGCTVNVKVPEGANLAPTGVSAVSSPEAQQAAGEAVKVQPAVAAPQEAPVADPTASPSATIQPVSASESAQPSPSPSPMPSPSAPVVQGSIDDYSPGTNNTFEGVTPNAQPVTSAPLGLRKGEVTFELAPIQYREKSIPAAASLTVEIHSVDDTWKQEIYSGKSINTNVIRRGVSVPVDGQYVVSVNLEDGYWLVRWRQE